MAAPASDRVDHPHAGWWVMILSGLTMNALVAFDAGVFAWWQTHVTAALPQRLLQMVFLAAVVTHVAEATYAARLATRSGRAGTATGWFVQTLVIGFPSLRLLCRRVAGPSA